MDIKKCMDELEINALGKFEKIKINTQVGIAKKISKKDQIILKVPPDAVPTNPNKPCKYAKTYVCNDISKDPYTTFLLGIMSTALFDSQDSPMFKALLESELGSDYVQGYGYDFSTRQGTFTIGLNGISEKDDKKVEETILKTLKKLVETGFDKALLESALHQFEIRNKEVKENYGLMLISSMIPFTLHSQDPLIPLKLNEFIDMLRTQLAKDEPVFQDLITKYLLENTNYVRILTVPDSEFMLNLNEKEAKSLLEMKEKLTEESSVKINEETKELLVVQNKEQNVDLLPTLKVEDIEKMEKSVNYSQEVVVGGMPVKYIIQPTNGISYIRLKTNIYDLPVELRGLLPMYRGLINSLGTEKHSYNEFDIIKDLYTVAGITSSYISRSENDTIDRHSEQFVMKIAFLDRNIDNAFEILTEFLTQLRFDEYEHITNLIQRSVKGRTQDLLDSGTNYGSSLASSSLTSAANSYESLEILKHDCNLAAQLMNAISGTKILDDILLKLKQIHSFILNKSHLEFLVHTSEEKNQDLISERLSFLENSLKHTYPNFEDLRPPSEYPKFDPFVYQAYFTLPIQVNYIVEAFMGTHYDSEDYPVLKILCEIMSMKSLLKEVREKGGAYGAGAKVDSALGTIVLSSFRDPNTLKTFNAFEKSIIEFCEGRFTDRDIDEGKLGVFSKIDKPVAVYDKGIDKFLYKIDLEMKQRYRERLIGVNREKIIEVAKKYLEEPLQKGLSSKVIFGMEDVNKKELRDAGWKVQAPIEVISNKQ
ncbi:hypothetical protein SteCoe_15115 [Stentor coeruleus]|uniref:Peptidase M16C associated domain-containing protein n=1 Tax=Stentor coeruleus TaxID=5963 RepID=A0A1R2C4F0_9CILI|nr:hypothetical protein SteCoe_15115 [Stentor coeruleus]